MTDLERLVFWAGVLLYAFSFTLLLVAMVFGMERHMRTSRRLLWTGFFLQTAAIAVRWKVTGHVPTVGNYETAMASAWLVIVFTLYVLHRQVKFRFAALGTIGLSLILMGVGVLSNPTLRPMSVALRSFWLYVHIFFASLAFAAFAVACGIGILYMLKEPGSTGEDPRYAFTEKLPSLSELDEMMFRYVVFGFIMDAVMIASGAIWAKDLWGNYWSWDPVETWSLVSWLMYGLFIHLRVSLGWRGKKLAFLTVLGIIAMFITFWGVNFVVEKSAHVFNVR